MYCKVQVRLTDLDNAIAFKIQTKVFDHSKMCKHTELLYCIIRSNKYKPPTQT